MEQFDWNSDTMKDLIVIIKQVVYDVLKEQGVPCYLPAIVHSINSDNTVNIYLPPDNTTILYNKLNKTGQTLLVGDSVELCCKKGRLGDAWIAVRHGQDEV